MSNPRPHQRLKLRSKCMPVIHNGTLVSVRQPGPTTCGVHIHSQIAVADLYRTVSASRCSDRKFKGGKNLAAVYYRVYDEHGYHNEGSGMRWQHATPISFTKSSKTHGVE